MNTDLIARIDEMMGGSRAEPVGSLLRACKAEIERLEIDLNKVVWLSMQEINQLKTENKELQEDIDMLHTDVSRLSFELDGAKEYVPMTQKDWGNILYISIDAPMYSEEILDYERYIEVEVIKRAGLLVKEDV